MAQRKRASQLLMLAILSVWLAQPSVARAAEGEARSKSSALRPAPGGGGSEQEVLDAALLATRQRAAERRFDDGIADTITGGLLVSLGTAGLIAGREIEELDTLYVSLFAVGLIGLGLEQVVEGIWDLASPSAIERSAERLRAIQNKQMTLVFLEEQAYRARRQRLVEASVGVTAALGTAALGLPFLLAEDSSNQWLGYVSLGIGALELGSAVLDFFGTSAEELIYEQTLQRIGMKPSSDPSSHLETRIEPAPVSPQPLRWAPLLVGDRRGRVGLGLGFARRF